MITTSKASLNVYSDTHLAADVTQILGIVPTESAEIGEPTHPPRKVNSDGLAVRSFLYKSSYWRFDVSTELEDSNDSFSSLLRLADALAGKGPELSALRENYRTRISYLGMSDSTQGGFVFHPRFSKRLLRWAVTSSETSTWTTITPTG